MDISPDNASVRASGTTENLIIAVNVLVIVFHIARTLATAIVGGCFLLRAYITSELLFVTSLGLYPLVRLHCKDTMNLTGTTNAGSSCSFIASLWKIAIRI